MPSGRGQMRLLILNALKSQPMTRKELVEHITDKRPNVSPDKLYWRVDSALNKMRLGGVVQREGRVWVLVERRYNER